MNILNDIIISEVTKVLTEIRGSFNWKEFKKIKGWPEDYEKSQVEYARKNLEAIGQGSGRNVFILSSRYALKVAKNSRGIAQNKSEIELSKNPIFKDSLPKIYKVGENASYIVVDIVRPLKRYMEFKDLTGIDWTSFEKILWTYRRVRSADNIKTSIEEQIEKYEYNIKNYEEVGRSKEGNRFTPEKLKKLVKELTISLEDLSKPFMEDIIFLLDNSDLVVGDLFIIGHWGKTPDGRVVLLDYGLTEEIFDTHY